MATTEVKSSSEVVGAAEYPIYDTNAEAIEHEGESEWLALGNAQRRTNELNRIRASATGKPTREALEAEAMASATIEELTAMAGDVSAIMAFKRSKVAELKVKYGMDKKEESEAEAG
tara:strand:+ start:1093 stop:1443 length:351 start_codon:yes stop_codon:yes gene_type:complete